VSNQFHGLSYTTVLCSIIGRDTTFVSLYATFTIGLLQLMVVI